MQMTSDARTWLDETVRLILARHALGDAERAGITYELMSHLHAAGEARATEAGRTEVTKSDLELALLDAGGIDELAGAFVAPLARPTVAAPLRRRAAAFLIDAVVLGVVLTFVHTFVARVITPFIGVAGPPGDHLGIGWILSWGFHDPAMAIAGQAAVALVSGVVVLGYFGWLEGTDGRTLGKRALDLRVVREGGQPMDARAAVVRNVVKLSLPLFALEALVLLIAGRDDGKRVSDSVAGTLVVKA